MLLNSILGICLPYRGPEKVGNVNCTSSKLWVNPVAYTDGVSLVRHTVFEYWYAPCCGLLVRGAWVPDAKLPCWYVRHLHFATWRLELDMQGADDHSSTVPEITSALFHLQCKPDIARGSTDALVPGSSGKGRGRVHGPHHTGDGPT